MVSSLKRIYHNYKNKRRERKKNHLLLQEFQNDFEKYNAVATEDQKAKKEFLYPCLFDKTEQTAIEPIYFYQDAWAFERIFQVNPQVHYDIGSNHKFVAQLSKVVNLTMIDIRPLSLPMDSIHFIKGSILNLPFSDESIESLSSICVIEHIGLGRYGDPIDPYGSEKAFNEIDRVLKINAQFIFSVPIEEINKTYFNAHRAFNEDYLLGELLKNYLVIDKKYIYNGRFVEHKEHGFGIGCYHLNKIR